MTAQTNFISCFLFIPQKIRVASNTPSYSEHYLFLLQAFTLSSSASIEAEAGADTS